MRRAQELIAQLQRDDGTVRLESPDPATRARFRRVIHAAKQHGLVPAGHHLRHTGRDAGDLVIRLYVGPEPDETDWNRIRLNTRRVTTDPDLLFTALERDPSNLAVTETLLPRTLALVRALAVEARRRGHRLGVNTKTKHPRLYLQTGQTRRAVTLSEEKDQVKHVPTADELRIMRRDPWRRPPEFDTVASGRLRLTVGRSGWHREHTWTDDKRARLEQRLPRIVREIETGVAEDEEARLAAQRAAEVAQAERRRQEEKTRQRWQAAITEARSHAVEKLRREAFLAVYDAWVAAGEIRAFCDALEAADMGADDTACAPGHLSNWLMWARAAADRLDPLGGSASLAATNFDPEPKADDLRPFLGDWSPRGPYNEFRSSDDEKRLREVRADTDTWHHGLRGRRTWWRR
jgi:hypothetical protein